MHGPERGYQKRGPEIAHEATREGKDQQDVDRVEEQVQPVITGGMIRVTEDRIVEQQRECDDGR